VAGGDREQVSLLVVEVLDHDGPVRAQRSREPVPLGRAGRRLPGRQAGHHLVERRSDPLMLGLHPEHDLGLEVSPGMQHRPEQLILADMMIVQPALIPAQVRGEHPGPARVAVRCGRDQGREQP
jgi:hypothetical protein